MSAIPGSPPPALAGPDQPMHSHPRALARYLSALALTPVLLFAAAFFVLPTRWYALHSGNPYLVNLGYGETLHNADCQILIYGDSSAAAGVDPAILQQITGLSACNVAEFAGMTLVNDTMVVDHFLLHNPRPRFLVFLYAPEDLTRNVPWSATFEAVNFRMQYARDWSTAALFLRRPADFFSWMELGLRLGLAHVFVKPFPDEYVHLRERRRGQFPLPGTTLTVCSFSPRPADPDRAWLQQLRARYGIAGTHVLIDATPEPDCDPSFAFDRDKLAEVTDNTLEQFPRSDYLAEGRLHMNPTGSRRLSAQLAQQILALERKP